MSESDPVKIEINENETGWAPIVVAIPDTKAFVKQVVKTVSPASISEAQLAAMVMRDATHTEWANVFHVIVAGEIAQADTMESLVSKVRPILASHGITITP